MFEQLVHRLPEGWREMATMLMAPIAWIPQAQQVLATFLLDAPSPWMGGLKFLFLLLPIMLVVVGLWCTQLSLYTLPFRSGRGRFVSLMLLAWWDAARMVWMFWIGIVRLVGVMAGWALSLVAMAVRLLVSVVKEVAMAPFTVTGMMTRNYFQPGVPWVAFIMLIFWSVLEAAVFTYTLFPTISEVLADLGGSDQTARFTGPILYMLLFLLILGSFACVHTLAEAIRKREMKFIVQMILVEVFVMMFEVMFLYRELVDAITPWLAQQTGTQIGATVTLTLASFGWIGVRGMTWFLFGQYGTPSLLAFISRQPIAEEAHRATAAAGVQLDAPWRQAIADFKKEIGWLHERSEQMMEYLALPVLNVLASMLNFAMILLLARPAFALPFRSLKDITESREALSAMHLLPRKEMSS
jgi:hypothetical protein